jgi:heme exporter protein D
VGENVETVFYILIFSVTCLTFFILYLNSYWKKTRVVVKVLRKKRHLSEQRATWQTAKSRLDVRYICKSAHDDT